MRKKRKSYIAAAVLLLAAGLTAGLAAGCSSKKAEDTASLFTGDPDAIRIFVWGNSNHKDILAETFPDIKFDFYEYNGVSVSSTMYHLLEKDQLGDLHINSLRVTDELAREHMMDLSGTTLCSQYEPSMLSQYDVDGAIYQLPGSISIRCILYNKDMFREHGWTEPRNFDELTALCRQIREETAEITPIVMGGAACGYYFTTMTTYSQCGYLYTPEGAEWEKKYAAGQASANQGFESGFEMMQELIDAQAFDYEKNYNLWDKELFLKRMNTGEAAMMFLWGSQDAIAQEIEESDTEYGVMPFRNKDGTAFLGTTVSYHIGLSKTLEEKGNEQKREDALRIMEWLSTNEGIYAVTNDASTSIFPLKGSGNPNACKLYQDLWEENLDCIKAPMLYSGYEDVLIPTGNAIMAAVKDRGSLKGIPDMMDQIHREYLEGGAAAIEVGSFARDFSHLETVQLLANALHEMGDSQIAMVSDGSVRGEVSNDTGAHFQFYEGSLKEEQLPCTVPGGTQLAPCVQMTLTGSQIKNLIENGKHMVMFEGDPDGHNLDSAEGAVARDSFDYYWAGMKAELKNGKVISMTLEDGTEMEENGTYTVTFASTDYTDLTAEAGNPVELDYPAKEALRAYLQNHSPISEAEMCR